MKRETIQKQHDEIHKTNNINPTHKKKEYKCKDCK